MPLDDAERSVLAETERALAAHDPGFARRFDNGWRGRHRGAIVLAAATALIVGLGWLGLAGQAFLIGALAIAVVVTYGWWPAPEIAAHLRGDDPPGARRARPR